MNTQTPTRQNGIAKINPLHASITSKSPQPLPMLRPKRSHTAKATKICPGVPPFQRRVRAALCWRDAGEGRASRGDPRYCWQKIDSIQTKDGLWKCEIEIVVDLAANFRQTNYISKPLSTILYDNNESLYKATVLFQVFRASADSIEHFFKVDDSVLNFRSRIFYPYLPRNLPPSKHWQIFESVFEVLRSFYFIKAVDMWVGNLGSDR